MTSKAGPKSFDCVKSMREIRNRVSAEIADMSYSELSRWLDRQVGDDPFFSRIPKLRRPERPAMERTGMSDVSSSDESIGHRIGRLWPRKATR